MRQFSLVMFLALTLSFSGCASKRIPLPAPVYGVDIVAVEKGSPAPFSGTLFSPFYLDNYLQWKDGQ
jgi:hypothetical protein